VKLYYAKGTCALASHIVLEELGLDYSAERMDTKTHLTETSRDFYQINPKGYVPALELDDGAVLTEGPAIMLYLADVTPGAGLVPPPGTIERARLQEDLTFIGTEIHKSYSQLFNPGMPEEAKAIFRDKIGKRYDLIEERLSDGRAYLSGSEFGPADAYLFVVTQWGPAKGVDISRWPRIAAFQQRVAGRPAVRRAIQAESAA
jgi:glutathione S-transferase